MDACKLLSHLSANGFDILILPQAVARCAPSAPDAASEMAPDVEEVQWCLQSLGLSMLAWLGYEAVEVIVATAP